MPKQRWWIHKFGGSSVADAACFRRVAGIIEADPHPGVAVVLSACRGVTDQLLGLVSAAERRDQAACSEGIAALKARHAELAQDLLEQPAAHHAALVPEIGDRGEVEVPIGRLEELEALGVGLHHAVLNAVVNHFDEVTAADGPCMNPAAVGGGRQRFD